MTGLMHEEAAAVDHAPVPPAKVVGAVIGIQVPVEVHRPHLSDRFCDQQALDLGEDRCVAVVEGHAHVAPRSALHIEDLAAPHVVDRHRFLGDDVAAGEQRPDDEPIVSRILRRDDHGLRPGPLEHGVERVEDVESAQMSRHGCGPDRVDVMDADDLSHVRIPGQRGLQVHLGPTTPGPHQGVPAAVGLTHPGSPRARMSSPRRPARARTVGSRPRWATGPRAGSSRAVR